MSEMFTQRQFLDAGTNAFQNGRKMERERVIKLLNHPMHHNIQSPDIHKDCYTCVLVDLIKGEQK
jgi:hypothetical protein